MPMYLTDNYPDTIFYDNATKTFRNVLHDSLVINKNAWYRFSTGRGGDNIQYMMEMLDHSFINAVKTLSEYENYSDENDIASLSFNPPRRSHNQMIILEYLTSRGLSKDVIGALMARNMAYGDVKNNVVFYNNTPLKRMCIIKGTLPDVSFNKIITEVPHNYWYFQEGDEAKDIFICESPIDAISLYEYKKRADGIYTAMAGLKIMTLNRILKELNPQNTKKIHIAVDWDDAGIKFCSDYNLSEKYEIESVPKHPAYIKDWNGMLQIAQGVN